MKYIILLISLFGVELAFGQVKLDDEQKAQVLRTFNVASAKTNSMQCNFLQIKEMKLLKKQMQSKGKMFFVRPQKLCWQYDTPYKYTFILNGDKVHIKSDKSSQTIDIQKNKMFRQIADIILNSITGGHLSSSSDFSVEIWKHKNFYSAKLFPQKKELKKLYNLIEITFDYSMTMVKTIKMEEKSGDVTIVTLNNVVTNATIKESVFNIH